MAKFITPYIELIAAYGRKYETKDAVLKDWAAGKDFQDVFSGQYCSVRDVPYMKKNMETDTIGFRIKNDLVFIDLLECKD